MKKETSPLSATSIFWADVLLALVLLALSLPMAWLLRLIPGAGKWLT